MIKELLLYAWVKLIKGYENQLDDECWYKGLEDYLVSQLI